MWRVRSAQRRVSRRGVIVVLTAILLVVLFAFVAFAVDIGYMTLVKNELQNAADAAALAAAVEIPQGESMVKAVAKSVGGENPLGDDEVALYDEDIVMGRFDFDAKQFVPGTGNPNAVRVFTRVKDQPLFFAPVVAGSSFSLSAEAIAMLNPRDIVFVVDLSGSMNDDTEPCWATWAIDDMWKGSKSEGAGADLVETLYADFGFGAFPGEVEYLGKPLGVPSDRYAYAEMTDDFGPLTDKKLPAAYRIDKSDGEDVRKKKAYSWIIDEQIARLMPEARPTPDSATNYGFWEKYLDYVILPTSVGEDPPAPKGPKEKSPSGSSPSPSPGPAPAPKPSPPIGSLPSRIEWESIADMDVQSILMGSRYEDPHAGHLFAAPKSPTGTPRQGKTTKVWLPPDQDGDRIDDFNNPNWYTFPSASAQVPRAFRNHLGYITYVQFMLDWGRDRSPDVSNGNNASPDLGTKVQLSVLSPYCTYHNENVGGTGFTFPPRTQPMHAARRSLIRAIQVVAEMNRGLSGAAADRVAIVTYDALDAYHQPETVIALTSNYPAAMKACTTLQATSDIGTSTATEVGLQRARDLLKPITEGGMGRPYASKVVILLTDGVPNVWEMPDHEISNHVSDNPGSDWYPADYPWYNSALVQASRIALDGDKLFGVGLGMGADYDFMDRLSRLAGTDVGGKSPRGSADPTEYEKRLTEIFVDIIKRPGTRLVK